MAAAMPGSRMATGPAATAIWRRPGPSTPRSATISRAMACGRVRRLAVGRLLKDPRRSGLGAFCRLGMDRHASLALEDVHGGVDADSRQRSQKKHVLAARAARNCGKYRLNHDKTLDHATNQN